MKKNLIAIIFSLLIVAGAYLFATDADFLRAEVDPKVGIAACPSYHHLLPALNDNNFKTVRASSTSKAVSLFQKEEVDFIISSRKLKPDEPVLESAELGEGYFFLSRRGFSASGSEMENISFYTDLDPKKIKSYFDKIQEENLTHTENPYSKIDEGVVITSFENLDYSEGELVDFYDQFGRRIDKIRRPTLYFSQKDSKLAEEIVSLIAK